MKNGKCRTSSCSFSGTVHDRSESLTNRSGSGFGEVPGPLPLASVPAGFDLESVSLPQAATAYYPGIDAAPPVRQLGQAQVKHAQTAADCTRTRQFQDHFSRDKARTLGQFLRDQS